MAMTWLWMIVCVTVAGATADRGGSSLRGALEALQRRQRGRMHGPIVPQTDYDALYEFVPPQGYPEADYTDVADDVNDETNQKYLVKFLDDNDRPPEAYEYKIIKKNSHLNSVNPNKQESAFRERAHANNDKLRDLFLEKAGADEKKIPEVNDKDTEYAVLLGQLWSKYKHSQEREKQEGIPRNLAAYKEKVVKKRYPDNWGPIAFKKKRSSDPDVDRPILPDYDEPKRDLGTLDSSPYNINDDDKDDFKEEYAIAFQPLDDDALSDLADDDQYTYDNVEKRFPVTKRSSGPYDLGAKKKFQTQNKREIVKPFRRGFGTDPKTLKDLSKIFGDPDVEIIKTPVKRSSQNVEDTSTHEGKPPMLPVIHDENHTSDQNNSKIIAEDDSHEHHGHNIHHPGVSGEVEVDVEQTHQHNHENLSEKPINVKKKSIDWSDYFGIDKRLKSDDFLNDLAQNHLRRQYLDTFNNEVVYPSNPARTHNYAKRNLIKPKPRDDNGNQIDQPEAFTMRNNQKRSTNEDSNAKLDNIDKNLKNMEGFIVDKALKYSNTADELDSKEEQEMKEKLLSRLAAAYSLEKMRKALKEFKQNLQTQKDGTSPGPDTDEAKAKRVAVKKELLNNEIPLSNKVDDRFDDFEEEQGAGHYLNGKVEEQFSEGYMGGSGRHRVPSVPTAGAAGSCPVLSKIIQRCRNVDLLAGDRGQLFLPLCSLHQICYLCGEAPPTTCDLVFLSEADTMCEGDTNCQRAARAALMALRDLHDNLADELDGECEASPCLPAVLKLDEGWQRALQR